MPTAINKRDYYRSQLCLNVLCEIKTRIIPVNQVQKHDPAFNRNFEQN